jgi:alpha-tubulin suppressor-like RCC1 family protein
LCFSPDPEKEGNAKDNQYTATTRLLRSGQRQGAGPTKDNQYTATARYSGVTSAWAWGENGNGQLGDGTTTSSSTPVQAPNLGKVKAISAGMFHSLALKTDGTIWAWGWNAQGQLGDETTTDRHTPVQVQNLSGVKAISAGGAHNLALKTDGMVWAWGSNLSGQLGNGASTGLIPNPTPVQVRGESPTSTQIVRLLLRLPLFSTALSLLFSAAFLPWNYLSDVQAISAGSFHSLALKTDGTARAWGTNWAGQLGDETTTERLTPVKVHSLSGVKAIATHMAHSLALKTAGSVWAWGFNDSGQVGDGTSGTFANRTAPVQVQNLSQVKAISTGVAHSLAKVSKTPGAEQ